MSTKDQRNVEVTMTLKPQQTIALAQFFKRTGHSDCKAVATSENWKKEAGLNGCRHDIQARI